MKQFFTLCLLTGSVVAAHAQNPITISQRQFPATAATVDRYQNAVATGLTAPRLGANRTWDYSSLTPQGGVSTRTYAAIVGTPPIAGGIRTVSYTFRLGNFPILVTGYEGFDTWGLTQIGSVIAAQSFSLTTATGGANDVFTISAQNTTDSLLRVALPLTSTTRTVRFKRNAYPGRLTMQAQGFNQAPFRYVQRVTYIDSVAGWGTLRVPVTGSAAGSGAISVLLVQRRVIAQDSFYVNNQPAPAVVLSALGLTQGLVNRSYAQYFYRQNSAQYMLALFYSNASFATPANATYSAETNLVLAAMAPREVAAGGLMAWPNPVVRGQVPHFLLANVAAGQPLCLTLRDATGRVVISRAAVPNGQPASLPALPPGLYLAEAEAANGAHASRRVVVE